LSHGEIRMGSKPWALTESEVLVMLSPTPTMLRWRGGVCHA
jgi:hypothetical protein